MQQHDDGVTTQNEDEWRHVMDFYHHVGVAAPRLDECERRRDMDFYM
jgi:hypothetical protein